MVNRQHLRQHFSKAAARYDEAAVLQKLSAQNLDERLDLMAMEVKQALDVGAGTGFLTEKLLARYPHAQISALDLSDSMLQQAKQRLMRPIFNGLPPSWSARLGWLACPVNLIQADAYALPVADASQDLVVTNFMLQWCDDLDAVLAEFRRVLRPEGLLMLTSLGPDTLKELRQAWVSVEGEAGHQRMNHFIDMHDLGDALIRAGFGQPVMDVEHYTLTYDEPIGVMRDLKAIGATNAQGERAQGLTGKTRFKAMLDAYELARKQGKIPASYEIVHGHAWAAEEVMKGPGRNKSGVYEITLDQFQNQLKPGS